MSLVNHVRQDMQNLKSSGIDHINVKPGYIFLTGHQGLIWKKKMLERENLKVMKTPKHKP